MTDPGRDDRPEMFGTLLASRPARDGRGTARTTVGAVIVHGALIAGLVWATMAVGSEVVADEQITFIEIPEEEPPPPPPPPEPAAPAPPEQPVEEMVKGFQTLTIPDIVPPEIPPPKLGIAIREEDFSGRGVEGGRADGKAEAIEPKDDLSLAPAFTPYTVKPELRNAAEVGRALQRNYPPLLRDAGIGGTTVMWFFIDETGKVVKTQLFKGSGHDGLDEAAARVATIMQFSPALNRDRAVQVWVQIPITFQSR